MDKTTIPLYLLLSGTGAGKLQNAAELHNTAYRCFNGTYPGSENDELADLLVFHVSIENGAGLRTHDVGLWRAIGNRMLPETDTGTKTTIVEMHAT